MNKYIDAEKLKADIEKRLERYDPHYTNAGKELERLLSLITSLQQEQPEVGFEKELDITKEIEEHAGNMPHCEFSHYTEDGPGGR